MNANISPFATPEIEADFEALDWDRITMDDVARVLDETMAETGVTISTHSLDSIIAALDEPQTPLNITATYAGIDSWGRAVFKDAEGNFYCIVDRLFTNTPTTDRLAGLPIYTKGRHFEGEPAWTAYGVELKVEA